MKIMWMMFEQARPCLLEDVLRYNNKKERLDAEWK